MVGSLEQVKRALNALVKDEQLFMLVNTRLALRTGIDLRNITAEQNSNPDLLLTALVTLKAMGYPVTTSNLHQG
ncbi:MAG TPA: hypothetical protein VEY30_13895 [Myxococcaceae bacterium]|nr:hypothetical protein [Myxococcaceae bacterium]